MARKPSHFGSNAQRSSSSRSRPAASIPKHRFLGPLGVHWESALATWAEGCTLRGRNRLGQAEWTDGNSLCEAAGRSSSGLGPGRGNSVGVRIPPLARQNCRLRALARMAAPASVRAWALTPPPHGAFRPPGPRPCYAPGCDSEFNDVGRQSGQPDSDPYQTPFALSAPARSFRKQTLGVSKAGSGRPEPLVGAGIRLQAAGTG